MQTPNDITAVLERLLPVGSIVEWSPVDSGKADLSTPEKVAAYYGFTSQYTVGDALRKEGELYNMTKYRYSLGGLPKPRLVQPAERRWRT